MEIFIIGGGISGLFCGINLAESGIDVKIIEKKEEIGKPLKCAEGVSENGIEILGDREIIESVKKKEIKGSVMILPNGKKIYFIKKGFLIDREKLEKLLEMKFLKNGGKIIRDKVERIEGNKIFGLKKIYKGDLIVIASGTNFIKGIEYPYKGFLFATEKRIKSNEENEFLKFYYGEIYKPIYMWKFYHGDYFGIGKAYRDKKEFEIIKNFLNERDVFKTITGKLPFPLNPPKFLYKDKKFFIGDAGAFVNQLTFAGIHGALLSAILCAERIKEFLKNKNYNELEKFNENLKILPIFSKSIYKARNILYSSSDSELNLIGELMDRRKYDEIPYIKAIKNLIKNPLFTKTYLKFLYVEKIFKKCENFSF
ncbi:MAG: NAD(P)/FAD-dependent oxidoreductase [candidate division WOR-3 bacterium]